MSRISNSVNHPNTFVNSWHTIVIFGKNRKLGGDSCLSKKNYDVNIKGHVISLK